MYNSEMEKYNSTFFCMFVLIQKSILQYSIVHCTISLAYLWSHSFGELFQFGKGLPQLDSFITVQQDTQ